MAESVERGPHVREIDLNVISLGVGSQPSQTNDLQRLFLSLPSLALSQDGWLSIRIMCDMVVRKRVDRCGKRVAWDE